ncbi:SDR family oxidoreductase [Mycobacterium sp. 852002-40037_SCH5390672]|uniref:SDR family oxidoreductase n=1 Tax=Mycobacterium sp. 852002-40037_SCH5390672 TaxID=1834089 RepID=UPI0008055F51|nr:SDR family NAD(P)-dependent oxidoreductase [Mycobacterium sp. 852002-40037_SCH5390672]OBB96355.1 oxidoreductase [Mycobacterium sp. 852002-40037_SCH5390672]
MRLTGNTVLVTGGGTGIGRALAIALHRRGNRVVITGRRAAALRAVAEAYPGIEWHPLDVAETESVRQFVATVGRRWPDVNVLINNAGVMALESPYAPDPAISTAVVATNLLGPIVLTSLLLPTLCNHPDAAIVNITSALAFVPLAIAPTYSATKAALHSYTESLRILLQESGIHVIEIPPPRIRTEMDGPGSADSVDVDEFVAEIMSTLSAQPHVTEVVVEAARALRYAEREGDYDGVLAALNTDIKAEDVL